MNVMNPTCTNCNGSGNDGGAPCPLCKGGGRLALKDVDTPEEWVRWIREQPDVKHGVEVLNRFMETQKPAPVGKGGKGKEKDD